jgi:uncharacterized membrane protein
VGYENLNFLPGTESRWIRRSRVESRTHRGCACLKTIVRWTAKGAAVGGGLFFALSMYRSIASGGPSMSHLNPIGVMTVIGVTVGALVGPLIGTIFARRSVLTDEQR